MIEFFVEQSKIEGEKNAKVILVIWTRVREVNDSIDPSGIELVEIF